MLASWQACNWFQSDRSYLCCKASGKPKPVCMNVLCLMCFCPHFVFDLLATSGKRGSLLLCVCAKVDSLLKPKPTTLHALLCQPIKAHLLLTCKEGLTSFAFACVIEPCAISGQRFPKTASILTTHTGRPVSTYLDGSLPYQSLFQVQCKESKPDTVLLPEQDLLH